MAGVEMLNLLVAAKTQVAEDIWLFDLRSLDGDELPRFEAGAHIEVRTPAGPLRRYSLCSRPADRFRYQIGVKHEPGGSGGSTSMVEDLRPGDVLPVSEPVNYFPLNPDAGHALLIAGGIGITPILAMARHLHETGKSFNLVYCARSAAAAAFIDVLAAPEFTGRTVIHYDGGDVAQALDLQAHLANPLPGAHLYCCGPRGLMEGVREATRFWPPGTVHFEDFGTSAHPGAGTTAFHVRLERSGTVLEVGPDETLLDVLERHGIEIPNACRAGTCGTCRCAVLAGIPDHRDFVLANEERMAAMMVCVSRALTEELTLDL
jgi:phthalate 4,5-dioxygenase reductase subunit